MRGTNIDLLHVLFGNILAMDDQTLLVVAFNATITLLVLAVIFRPLVIESVDPVFLRTVSRAGGPAHLAFLALVVINLVNGFQALGTLSGGQMQRMLFARVLLQDARLIVLDEPFNAIDAKTAADLIELVRRWHAEQRTVLAALHDMELVRMHFPETLLLARGPVAWGPTAQVLTAENLREARRMCEAFDDSAAACVAETTPSRAA